MFSRCMASLISNYTGNCSGNYHIWSLYCKQLISTTLYGDKRESNTIENYFSNTEYILIIPLYIYMIPRWIVTNIVDNKTNQAWNPKQPFIRYNLYTIDDIQLYLDINDVRSLLVVIQYLNLCWTSLLISIFRITKLKHAHYSI